jgi:hypothetical protein
MTCGSTAGYLTPLLRSESQIDYNSMDTPNGSFGIPCKRNGKQLLLDYRHPNSR